MSKRLNRIRYTGRCDADGNPSLDGNMSADLKEHFKGREFEVVLKAKTTPRRPWQINYWWGIMVRDVMIAVNDQCGENFSMKREADRLAIYRMILRNCWGG